jgi:hypothetical protein
MYKKHTRDTPKRTHSFPTSLFWRAEQQGASGTLTRLTSARRMVLIPTLTTISQKTYINSEKKEEKKLALIIIILCQVVVASTLSCLNRLLSSSKQCYPYNHVSRWDSQRHCVLYTNHHQYQFLSNNKRRLSDLARLTNRTIKTMRISSWEWSEGTVFTCARNFGGWGECPAGGCSGYGELVWQIKKLLLYCSSTAWRRLWILQ